MAIITEIKKSHKNIVTIENCKAVKKVFTDEVDYLTELNFYQQYAGLEIIPRLLETKQNTLYLEYIDGDNIYDVYSIIHNDRGIDVLSFVSPLAYIIAKSLSSFHNLSYDSDSGMSLIHYDTNLNNYIFKTDKIYMVDFSDVTLASPLSDVYSILLFFYEILSPSEFMDFTNTFLSSYNQFANFPITHSENLLQYEINRFKERREQLNKKIPNLEEIYSLIIAIPFGS